MRHNHRIIPGHMGGEYAEGNVISVEVTNCNKQTANHIMWHYANWRLWGKIEDKIAWKGLAGQWGKEEIIGERIRLGGLASGKLLQWTNGVDEVRSNECPGEGWVRGRSKAMKEKIKNYRTGKKDSPETKQNKSRASKGKSKSKSHCEAIKNGAKRGEDHPNYGKVGSDSPTYGTKRTPEQLEKMSGARHHNYGKVIPKDVKEKIRQTNKKKKHWVNGFNEHKFQEICPGEGWVNGRKYRG